VSLDPLTCELFADWFDGRRHNAADLAVGLPRGAFAFSPEPDGSTPWNPDTMTHRYRRYARRIGITSSLKELRHYSATELLHAGVDLNTVAGRLGHAEGSTTLKFYAQFTASADKRAAAIIPARLDALRKQERLRELYWQEPPGADLDDLAAKLAEQAGLDHAATLSLLAEFAAQSTPAS
jgi:integrase